MSNYAVNRIFDPQKLIKVIALVTITIAAVLIVYPTGHALSNDKGQVSDDHGEQLVKKIDPLIKGELAAFVISEDPTSRTDIKVIDSVDKELNLGEWKGKIVLVNLWATWCAPCRHEMPAFDELQAKLGSDQFEVVTINVDRGGTQKGKNFFKETDLKHLNFYYDETGKLMRKLRVFGLPVTLLIDRNGLEVARLTGPAEWASKDALEFVEAALTVK